MSSQLTFIGMDLGSFKTSVTCSNGRRDMMPTAVGWPKDHVALAKVGSEVVFGSEIRRRRLILDVVRPFEHGLLKYNQLEDQQTDSNEATRRTEAARLIVSHAVDRMQSPAGSLIYGVIGSPSRASMDSKQCIMHAAQAAFDAVAIVPEPFAIAFSMGDMDEALVVDIGAGTIDICPVLGKYPTEEEQVTIGFAGDALDESLQELLAESHPHVSLPREMVRDLKEKYGFVHEPHEPVVVALPTDDTTEELDLTDPLRQSCLKIIDPIVSGIREVLRRVDPEYRDLLRRNIVLGGGGSQLRGLDQVLERELSKFGGGTVRRAYDSAFAGAVGALKLAMAMPSERWDHIRSLAQQAAA